MQDFCFCFHLRVRDMTKKKKKMYSIYGRLVPSIGTLLSEFRKLCKYHILVE